MKPRHDDQGAPVSAPVPKPKAARRLPAAAVHVPAACPAPPPERLLEPFEPCRLPYVDVPLPAGAMGRFAAEVSEVCNGMEVVLELLHASEMEAASSDNGPLLDCRQRDGLLRLLTHSVRHLGATGEDRLEVVRRRAAQAGVTE
jgi:hypothetical protein